MTYKEKYEALVRGIRYVGTSEQHATNFWLHMFHFEDNDEAKRENSRQAELHDYALTRLNELMELANNIEKASVDDEEDNDAE